MDVSSEMIHALLPVFLVTVLGAGALTVGTIEGVGEATAAITKLFSGWLSDRLGRRKMLAVFGYGFSAFSKPLFALAPTASWVLAARFADRLGKGTRGAPRDALIGDMTPVAIRGAAYGLRQSLDTVGAFLGPVLAIGLMMVFHGAFRLVFWWALAPAMLAVGILVIAVREPSGQRSSSSRPLPIRWKDLRGLGPGFWGVMSVAVIISLGRFSDAFLILRARDAGLPIDLAPIVLVVMNVVYASTAYPTGVLSDKAERRFILWGGFLALIAADIVLATVPGLDAVMFGVALWGLHMGLTQGLLSTLVADAVSIDSRGTAFGFFHLLTGTATLAASVVAGLLWSEIGFSATFLAGAVLTSVGLIGVALTRSRY